MRWRGWLVTWLVVASACGDNRAPDDPVLEATWFGGVAPIVARSCMGCHREGGIAPFSLETYGDVVENAPRMVHAIETGLMPPFYARETDDCRPSHPLRDDPRLSAFELDLLREWIAADYPLGDTAKVPAPPATELDDATMTLSAVQPWTATGMTDQFVCMILDPQTTTDTWLSGLQVRPGNALVVHHVQIDQLPNGPTTQTLVEKRGIGQPYTETCGRTPPHNTLVHLWTPGSQPLRMDGRELALQLDAYAKLMVQIHYHPGGRVNAPDVTAVDLRLSETPPRMRYFPVPVGNEAAAPRLQTPDFVIPAGASDHVEHIVTPMDYIDGRGEVRIVSASPHMHMVGTQIWTRLLRPNGTSECLSNSHWSFDWQRTFTYDAPIEDTPLVRPTDSIEVKCRYDNTTNNPSVLRMLADAQLPPVPVDVWYGPNTGDEMCLETFGFAEVLP